ncbi:enoyl-CoA hydratase/isomerase family protein [Neisseriaceae bacterium JH1-16]|nr:enoyl-CoA hydratase/isomerase family protein [Neisseriaceae bacterium JH1-16]
MSDAPVLFHTRRNADGSQIGIATLNNPAALNALNLAMIRLLDAQLAEWAADPAIALVVLHGAGDKAFCAGGDVKGLRAALLAEPSPAPHPAAVTFFTEEYRLDHRLHVYPKPLLIWGSGIVMGGGMGLLQGASVRIVTDTSRLAMPEVSIGLYPDVGGSWFLARLPSRLGRFLALTGAPLNAHDALLLGLADRALPHDSLPALLDALSAGHWQPSASANRAELDRLLERFTAAHPVALPDSPIARHQLALQTVLQAGDMRDVAAGLIVQGKASDDPWLTRAAETLAHGSPSTAAVSWAIQERLATASLADAFRAELNLSVNFCAKPDFLEGVRARLVDKDQAPRWQPATLAEVDQDWIDGHFIEHWPADAHPLRGL